VNSQFEATRSWVDAHRVVAAHPGPHDGFLVVLADGKRVWAATADQYEEVLGRARVLAQKTEVAVKVLPMTASEFIGFTGMSCTDVARTPQEEAVFRALVTQTFRSAMMVAPDLATRREARDALMAIGEVA